MTLRNQFSMNSLSYSVIMMFIQIVNSDYTQQPYINITDTATVIISAKETETIPNASEDQSASAEYSFLTDITSNSSLDTETMTSYWSVSKGRSESMVDVSNATHVPVYNIPDMMTETALLNNNLTGHSEASSLLDQLLKWPNYDSRLRPGHGGRPDIVKADMNIRSMGPISEADMAYSMDAYFRQTWVDKRLRFEGTKEMAVHYKTLELIWKPDTFFHNGRGSYLHMISEPNKLFRIKPDGTVLYSMRLTIKASCPMYLQYFPIDEQLCPLQFGSYAYPQEEIVYLWKHGADESIKMAKDMTLSQFDLIDIPATNFSVERSQRNFTTLKVNFRLRRHMGYFLIQVYLPCSLIVVLSWVSFWINREATADRIGLGITTVLTLTTLSMDARGDLPKVAYPTALDWFVLKCYVFVIASLLEFAGVHYFTKVGTGEYYREVDITNDSHHTLSDSNGGQYHNNDQEWENSISRINMHNKLTSVHDTNSMSSPSFTFSSPINNHHHNHTPQQSPQYGNTLHNAKDHPHPHNPDNCLKKFFRCLQSNTKYRQMMAQTGSPTGVNSVSLIDRMSRILFPLTFTSLNVMYWVICTRSDGPLLL